MATNHRRKGRHVPFKDTRRSRQRGEERLFTAQEVEALRARMVESFNVELGDMRRASYGDGFKDGQNHIRRAFAELWKETP